MKLSLVAVGGLKNQHVAALCDEYVKRIGRYARPKVIEVRESRRGSPEQRRSEEATAITSALPKGSMFVLLDERGKSFTSRKLASYISERTVRGISHMAIVVGGPYGVDPALRKAADLVWSLAAGTLPHELARMLALEQLYRALTINAGAPYHND